MISAPAATGNSRKRRLPLVPAAFARILGVLWRPLPPLAAAVWVRTGVEKHPHRLFVPTLASYY